MTIKTIAVAAIAIVAIGVAVIVATGVAGQGTPPRRSGSAPSGAATVQRRDLVATNTESGTLGYAGAQTVYNRLSGTVTWLPAAGQVIEPGQTLFKIDNAPVVLFDGATPAYRTLRPGVSDGPDVRELNRDLANMGFDPYREIVIDDVWQAATTFAVERWQASLAERQTATITLGQIAFERGAQRVTAVDAVLGSSGQTALREAARRTYDIALRSGTTRQPAQPPNDQAQVLAALEALLRAQLKSNAARSPSTGSGSPNAGSNATAVSQAILQTASTRLVVTVDLSASSQGEAVLGEPVTVELPDGSEVDARVTQVSPVASSPATTAGGAGGGSDNGSGNDNGSGAAPPSIPVTVSLTGRLPSTAGLDQATVSVNFVQQQASNVLSVPVTALLATRGGGYALQLAVPPHRLLPVTTGLFAAGFVQVSGAGIVPGLHVTNAQG